MNIKFAGRYSIKRVKASGEIVQELPEFTNAITDIGLNRAATGIPAQYCYIGSGTTAAATNDTQMGNLLLENVNMTSATTNRTLDTPYWVERSTTWRFPPSGSNLNITEVGVGWTSDSVNGLWSRALTVDEDDNPVTITLLEDEYLDVTYTLRFYPPLTDSTYDVTINGTTHTFTSRTTSITTSTVNSYSPVSGMTQIQVYGGPCTLGPLDGAIENATSNTYGNGWMYSNTYITNSKKLTFTAFFDPTYGNVTGGITGIVIYTNPGLFGISTQFIVSPPIPKNNTSSLTMTYEYTWSRY